MKKQKIKQLNEYGYLIPYWVEQHYRDSQNPGLGGLDELTSAEEAVVQAASSLSGNSYKLLRVNSAETAVEWATLVTDETPTGTINGSNAAFTLANAPAPASSLKVYSNGIRLRTTTDFSVSGTTLTMVKAPRTGAILRGEYVY